MMILVGLMCTITLGGFVALITTSEIKNNIAKIIIGTIIAFVVGFGLVGLLMLEYKSDKNNWNNGICSCCNEPLEIFDIEHSRSGSDYYYYKCSNEHIVRTTNLFTNK